MMMIVVAVSSVSYEKKKKERRHDKRRGRPPPQIQLAGALYVTCNDDDASCGSDDDADGVAVGLVVVALLQLFPVVSWSSPAAALAPPLLQRTTVNS